MISGSSDAAAVAPSLIIRNCWPSGEMSYEWKSPIAPRRSGPSNKAMNLDRPGQTCDGRMLKDGSNHERDI